MSNIKLHRGTPYQWAKVVMMLGAVERMPETLLVANIIGQAISEEVNDVLFERGVPPYMKSRSFDFYCALIGANPDYLRDRIGKHLEAA